MIILTSNKKTRIACRIEKQISLMIVSICMRFGCILRACWVHVGFVLGPFCACQVASNANSLRIGPKSAPSRLISKLSTFRRRIFVWHKSCWRHFGITLKSLWGTLGSLWDHFKVTLRSLLAYEGDSGWVWHQFAIAVESLWIYKGPLSKNTHFPYMF